jgi:general secretion pathway protein H
MTSPDNLSAARRISRSAGFTLIEMIVVLAILGLTLAMVSSYRSPWSRTLSAEGAASQLAADLRLARSQAIASNRSVVVSVDLAGHQYRVGAWAVRQIPGELRIELLTMANERESNHVADIRFNPDGSSTGGRIVLVDDRRKIDVGIDWLTGRVSIADGS